VEKLQRYVLAVLHYSANGGSWRNSDLWLSDIDECDWYTSEAEDDICNSQGQLDEIDLDNNRLQGALPWNELSILESQLVVLDFYENELAGTISTSVGVFESLLVLDLFGNEHTGTIPTQLGGVTSLRYLDFSSNLLTGTLPRELSNMRGLQSLLLRDNSLSGTIPSQLGSLASLRNLHLVSLAIFLLLRESGSEIHPNILRAAVLSQGITLLVPCLQKYVLSVLIAWKWTVMQYNATVVLCAKKQLLLS
jgi:hypothetical protein